jgi:hypothetical protein
MVADGLVLIFVAATWYLLAMLITGRDLYMQNVARAALLVEHASGLPYAVFVWGSQTIWLSGIVSKSRCLPPVSPPGASSATSRNPSFSDSGWMGSEKRTAIRG